MEALICSVQKQKAYALIVEAAKTGINISSITSMVALVVLPIKLKLLIMVALFMTGASNIQTRRLKIVYKYGIYKVFIFVLSTGKYLYSLKVKQIHPSSFKLASDPGGTTQVASYSSIIHGPCLGLIKLLREKTWVSCQPVD